MDNVRISFENLRKAQILLCSMIDSPIIAGYYMAEEDFQVLSKEFEDTANYKLEKPQISGLIKYCGFELRTSKLLKSGQYIPFDENGKIVFNKGGDAQ